MRPPERSVEDAVQIIDSIRPTIPVFIRFGGPQAHGYSLTVAAQIGSLFPASGLFPGSGPFPTVGPFLSRDRQGAIGPPRKPVTKSMKLRTKPLAALAALALAGVLSAQVASQANSTYQTPEGRKAIAAVLGNPERDQILKPGALVREIGVLPGMTVADVGTGIGYMLPFLSHRVGPNGRVIAEDIFDDFLNAARAKAEDANLANVSFVKGTDTDPHLPEGELDIVLALDVYHHFDYPEKMLAAIHKSLRDGGKLVVVEYYKRPTAMPDGRAMTHIRLDMPDVIKETEANHFHLIEEKEVTRDSQYALILEKN